MHTFMPLSPSSDRLPLCTLLGTPLTHNTKDEITTRLGKSVCRIPLPEQTVSPPVPLPHTTNTSKINVSLCLGGLHSMEPTPASP